MDIFQNVLKKAKHEGKIDPGLIPWDNTKYNTAVRENVKLPTQLITLSDDVIDDFQKTIENIRIESETKSLQIIGVSSAAAGQGTSTFTAILSLIMAVTQRSDYPDYVRTEKNQASPRPGVLLIDAQIRNPSLHLKFDVFKPNGLTEILEGDIPFKKGIKKIQNSGLKFISSGENSNFHLTPVHLEKLKAYLNILKTKIEFVLLDIPPLLPYSEGIALSKLCDGLILVVEAGESRWEVVRQAKRLLDKANVNIIGSVLNKRKFYISKWAYKNL